MPWDMALTFRLAASGNAGMGADRAVAVQIARCMDRVAQKKVDTAYTERAS